jgi:hypothetical protein
MQCNAMQCNAMQALFGIHMSALLWAARHDAFVCVKLVLERLPLEGDHNTHEWANELVLGFVGLLDSEKAHRRAATPLPNPLRSTAPTVRDWMLRTP